MATGDPSNVSKFVRVFADQIQLLENATADVKILRQFAHAENAQLDSIGAIVGENRQGKSDAEYRIAILARINTNASRGEPERLITALRQITASIDIHLTEHYPAMVHLEFSSAVIVTGLLEYMQRVCSGGVKLIITQYSTTHPFRFDVGPDGFDNGHLGTLLT
jgi:predicted ATPase